MKITKVRAILTCLGRNYVLVKIATDEHVGGITEMAKSPRLPRRLACDWRFMVRRLGSHRSGGGSVFRHGDSNFSVQEWVSSPKRRTR